MNHPVDPGTDLYVINNQHYLCTVDYYSKWIEMDKFSDETRKTTIEVLKGHFARYGIPDELISDNGPQFSSKEFAKFQLDTQVLFAKKRRRICKKNYLLNRIMKA